MDENQKKYLEQIDRYYKKEMRRDEIVVVGVTPSFLELLSVPILPIVITQSTLNKCTRSSKKNESAHELSREIIENIPVQIYHPALIVDEKKRNSIVLISDMVDQNGFPLLTAILIQKEMLGKKVNQITSCYGRKNIEIYLKEKHTYEEVMIYDKEKAKALSRLAQLQLPAAWKVLDYSDICNERLQPFEEKVNIKICKDFKSNGFQPTQSLVSKIQELNRLSGSENSIRDVHTIYSGLKNPDIQKLVTEIAEECKRQEIISKHERE